jgi:hypothetical protein
MLYLGLLKLFLKVFFRLVWTHPTNFCFLEKRILFYANSYENTRKSKLINFKRLKYYNRVTTIFYTCLEHLTGKKLTSQQIEAASLFCGITPLMDDLMDEDNYSDAEINRLVQKEFPRNTVYERVCVGLYADLSERSGDIRTQPVFKEALDFQLKSRLQSGVEPLSKKEIEEITLKKGGYSFLLALQAISPDLLNDVRVEAAAFHLGASVQLTNDIYDIYKDRQSGLQTLLTTTEDMTVFRTFFEKYIAETQTLIQELPYTKHRKNILLFQYNALVSFARVALEQLVCNQKASSNVFKLQEYTRAQLVCDMHRWDNQKKVLKRFI